jgi:hypothetical protein
MGHRMSQNSIPGQAGSGRPQLINGQYIRHPASLAPEMPEASFIPPSMTQLLIDDRSVRARLSWWTIPKS